MKETYSLLVYLGIALSATAIPGSRIPDSHPLRTPSQALHYDEAFNLAIASFPRKRVSALKIFRLDYKYDYQDDTYQGWESLSPVADLLNSFTGLKELSLDIFDPDIDSDDDDKCHNLMDYWVLVHSITNHAKTLSTFDLRVWCCRSDEREMMICRDSTVLNDFVRSFLDWRVSISRVRRGTCGGSRTLAQSYFSGVLQVLWIELLLSEFM